jgi:pilus assembly protein FimV
LAKLAQESRATRAGVAELQAQLREAQEQRYANGLVYALGTLAALLSVALAVVLWRRPPAPVADGQWWASGLQREEASVTAAGVAPVPSGDSSAVPLAETTASPMLLQQIPAAAAEATATGRRPAPADPEMAVEELIDLEQQAEFFVVLGQDQAAIDLLTGHLDSAGAASPLPYLKLLEIHRRRGDREASERIRERFNRRFNAYAPEWQADPLQGRSLVDYPAVLSNLQRLWSTPARAMRALEASLFRRDGVDSTFDLPAYRELLFLYALARDLSEREDPAPGVDLLLPLAYEAAPGRPAAAAALRADPPASVDVDITRLHVGSGEEPSRDAGPSSFATPLEFSVPSTRR